MSKNIISTSILSSLFIASATSFAATYEITELAPLADFRQHFAMAINDNGASVGVARGKFDFPIYIEDYIFENEAFTGVCDFDTTEIETRELDALSQYCVKAVLASSNSFVTSPYTQKIGDIKSFTNVNNQTNMTVLTDVQSPELDNEYTYSNTEFLTGINNDGVSVGYASAPYYKAEFQQTGETAAVEPIQLFQRDYKYRATVTINGTVQLLAPTETQYGGISIASDISDSGFISGYMSTALADGVEDDLSNTETYDPNFLPMNIWAWQKQNQESLYTVRPVVWQIDNAGNIVNTTLYNVAFEPNDTQTGNYSASATAVNDSGIAVGYSSYPRGNTNSVSTYPVLFEGQQTQVFVDTSEYDGGFATDINNDGKIVGRVYTIISYNEILNRFFVYDTENSELTIPKGFYSTSDGTANAINDNGLVVGQAEYEVTNDNVRRKHGFLYDTNTGEFFDVNDLIACDSGYEVVEVRDINNNNEIVATALKTVDRLNGAGEVMLDDDGEVRKEQIAVAVKLTPLAGGSVNSCQEENTVAYERQGLTFNILMFLLIPLIYIRRKF